VSWAAARGRVTRGHRAASGLCRNRLIPLGTIRPQLRFFRGLPGFGARLRGRPWPGTVNVRFAGRVVQVGPAEVVVPAVRWTRLIPAENFLLSRCLLAHRGRSHPGYLYIPDPATKPGRPPAGSVVEVLTARIAGLRYGAPVVLRSPPGAFTLERLATARTRRPRSDPFGQAQPPVTAAEAKAQLS
jgi:hypothetical protein